MRTSSRTLAFCIALAAPCMVVTFTPSFAYADGVDPGKATPIQREQAQSRFMKGRELYAQASYERALEEFRASHEIVASPNARLYAARCLREFGQLVPAYSEFGRTAVQAREQARDDPRYTRTGESADEERRAIAPKLGFVTLTIDNPEESTTLKVAGEEIRRSGWGEPIPLSPGASDVTVETRGREPLSQNVTVGAGETKAITFDAASAAAAKNAVALAPAPSTDDAAQSDRRRAGMRTASFVAGGVGIAGVATFALFGALSSGKYSDLNTACKGGPCAPSRQDDIDTGKRDQTIANVGLVIGVVGVAAAVTLYLLSAPKKTSAPAIGLSLYPAGDGVGGTF